MGLLLAVAVTAANTDDAEAAPLALQQSISPTLGQGQGNRAISTVQPILTSR
jgi:hypothetical protein